MNMAIANRIFDAHLQTFQAFRTQCLEQIDRIGKKIVKTLDSQGKILICGNGGSAADAQHFAAELTGRFESERRALPAIALSTDTSALTAIGNDYGFERVFARQVEALGTSNDLLIAISTSGNSPNVLRAIEKAKEKKMSTIGLSGKSGGEMNRLCDINLVVPSDSTARIQEMHILTIHTLCAIVDEVYKTPL